MVSPHRFHSTTLREYDIRGIIGSSLSVADAAALGQSFGTMLRRSGGQSCAVGYDGRLSSPQLEQALVQGLQSAGISVTRIGLGPTPMLYFSVYHCDVDAGMMITGSHNPPEYNGFKMMIHPRLPNGGSVYGQAIQDLGKIAAAGDYMTGQGSVTSVDIKTAYVMRLVQNFKGTDKIKVAWDAGNGAAGAVLRDLTSRLPGTHILLYDQVDGTFPNHHPDPTVAANLQDLQTVVREQRCDLGIAFDGDGDRIGAIDSQGRVVAGDQLIALYARDILQKHPGATIIADVKASQTLFDEITRLGGTPLMWKTGHSLIKTKMKDVQAPLAGEMSGHIFFADDFYGHDDALYCGVRLLHLLAGAGQSLDSLRDALPQLVNTPELRFQVDESRKFKIVEEIKARLKIARADVNDIDGVRVSAHGGWWLLRASNTQDVLVARVEASDNQSLAALQAHLASELLASGVDLPKTMNSH